MSLQNTRPLPPGQGGEPVRSTPSLQRLPFASVPHDLTADLRLKPIDVRLVAVLLRYARGKASCWPSVKTLGADVARCERTIQYALKRLQAAGWIESRPDANPTGRLLLLTWRKPVAPPGVQAPYSQGMPRAKPVAPECRSEKERDSSALALGKEEAEKPMTPDEARSFFAASGLLTRPADDPLRRIVERNLARSLERAQQAPATTPTPALTPMVPSWRPG